MKFTKTTFVTAFALFSLFFGAGNLILPPFLGYNAGQDWIVVTLGFALSAVVIPIMAIYGHARLQGTMMDFAKKVSPTFALIYCLVVYAISVSLPAPRTASVTYEMAVQPYVSMPSWIVSTIYFGLVLLFVLNRSKVLDLVGKYLTPGIIILLTLIIVIGTVGEFEPLRATIFESPLTSGLIEGYQTFDAIGGVVVGGVIVISLGFKEGSFIERKRIIGQAGLLAGLGLLTIYGGLIALGALQSGAIEIDDRTALLQYLSTSTLGATGTLVLSVLVALACFTTAVGIVTGTADFIKGRFQNAQKAYTITAILGCLLGVLMGQLDVHRIIVVAVPALMLIYPVTIVLIVLNVLPQKMSHALVFRGVIATVIVFSIPDFLASVGMAQEMKPLQELIPLGTVSLGWLVPSAVAFAVMNGVTLSRKRTSP